MDCARMLTSESGFGTGVLKRTPQGRRSMTTAERSTHSREPIPDHEQKRVALGYLQEAWAEARLDGIDGDCLAQSCLFAAFAEFVATYGEEATAALAEGLGTRIRNGEFSLDQLRQ